MLMKEEMMLIESNPKAKWAAALDQKSNSGAHENSESFVMDNGEYITEQDIMDGNAVEDMPVNWGSIDRTPGV